MAYVFFSSCVCACVCVCMCVCVHVCVCMCVCVCACVCTSFAITSSSLSLSLFPLVAGVETTAALAEQESVALDKIKDLLTSVGGHRGSSSTKLQHSSSHSHAGKSNQESSSFKKINTVYYKEVYDSYREWITNSHLPRPLKAGDAESILKKMAEAEEYRKRCGSRILFLDGGGVRGLVQMTVLREIERRTGKKIVELFDWIVGTSTGGIIALALTYGELGYQWFATYCSLNSSCMCVRGFHLSSQIADKLPCLKDFDFSHKYTGI